MPNDGPIMCYHSVDTREPGAISRSTGIEVPVVAIVKGWVEAVDCNYGVASDDRPRRSDDPAVLQCFTDRIPPPAAFWRPCHSVALDTCEMAADDIGIGCRSQQGFRRAWQPYIITVQKRDPGRPAQPRPDITSLGRTDVSRQDHHLYPASIAVSHPTQYFGAMVAGSVVHHDDAGRSMILSDDAGNRVSDDVGAIVTGDDDVIVGAWLIGDD